MNLKKMMQGLVFFLTSLLVFDFLFRALLPTASPRMTKPKTAAKEITYTYVALGDSLTEGVGDSTKQGGFVPILAQSLSNENDGQYQPVNYGVAGNTSAQILDRLKKQTDLQKDLKKARVMTLTVGGNDLRKVVVDHLSDFSLSDIQKPLKNYTANLTEIITKAVAAEVGRPLKMILRSANDAVDLEETAVKGNNSTKDEEAKKIAEALESSFNIKPRIE